MSGLEQSQSWISFSVLCWSLGPELVTASHDELAWEATAAGLVRAIQLCGCFLGSLVLVSPPLLSLAAHGHCRSSQGRV